MLDNFLKPGATPEETKAAADSFIKLVSYLTGEEILVPADEDDDEYTYATYESGAQSFVSFLSEYTDSESIAESSVQSTPSLVRKLSIDKNKIKAASAKKDSSSSEENPKRGVQRSKSAGDNNNKKQSSSEKDSSDSKRGVQRSKSSSSDALLTTILEDDESGSKWYWDMAILGQC